MVDFVNYHKKAAVRLAIVISAVLMGICVMFTQLAVLQWVVIVPAAVCLFKCVESDVKYKKAYKYGLGFFWVYYAVIFHWFAYMYPLDFLGLGKLKSLVVVFLAWFGLSLLQAAFSALALPLFLFVTKRVNEKYKWLLPVVAAAIWVIVEFSLTITWAGVPWSRLALGQIDTLFAVQSVSLFGSYFITFLIVLINFLVAYALLYKRKKALSVGLCLLALNMLVGSIMLVTYKSDETIRVAATQGNVPSAEKWDRASRQKTLDTYKSFVREAAEQGAQYVVTPESVFPYLLSPRNSLTLNLAAMADEYDVYLLVGTFWGNENYTEIYNSILMFEPDGNINETLYFKRRLVPFGEFVPLEPIIKTFLSPLAEINAISSDFTPGTDSNVFDTEYAKIGSLICFDSIYEDLSIDSVRDGAEVLMISTNDSWFSDSAALTMHNNQARLRAIETGRSIVRSANTGISSVITPTGKVIDSIGANRKGIIIADVDVNTSRTLYSYIGNTFVYLCYAFLVGVKITEKIAFIHKKG